MTSMQSRLKKVFSRRLTLMIVPHIAFRTINLQFSFSFALFLILFWTGLTSWASWVVMKNVDYWTTKVNYQVLKLKVHYFATELEKSRQLLDQVRQADSQLRKFLGMKSRQSILEDGHSGEGKGGSEPFEVSILQKKLGNRLWEITESEIYNSSKVVQRESRERVESYQEISDYLAYERGLYRSTPYGWPAFGKVTSHFGYRVSPLFGTPQFHTGIDIANESGTPVRATANGVVQLADWEGGYGKLVIIDHGFDYATYYGHNSTLVVEAGEKVRRGQVIAYMGSSGSTTGEHTHYEIWHRGHQVNPWKYLIAKSAEDLRSLK